MPNIMTNTSTRASRASFTRFTALLAVLVAGSSVGLSACGKKDTANAQVPEQPTLISPENVGIADTMRIASGPALSGELSAERSASVRAEVAGSVIRVFVEAGQRVAAGAPLARIDATTANAAELSARTGVTATEASAAQAKKELDRAERLNAAGAIADRDLENTRLAYSTAMAQLANVQSAYTQASKQLRNARAVCRRGGGDRRECG
jgi:membrane fusion protein, multidrug efflux system